MLRHPSDQYTYDVRGYTGHGPQVTSAAPSWAITVPVASVPSGSGQSVMIDPQTLVGSNRPLGYWPMDTGHGPMVPYVPEHGMGSDFPGIRDDDPNPRPHKIVEGHGGTRWGLGPAVDWHGHTEMDYILGRLD